MNDGTKDNAHEEMKLPPGKTCGDCAHYARCRAFGFTSSAANTSCDFHPRRFLAREAAR